MLQVHGAGRAKSVRVSIQPRIEDPDAVAAMAIRAIWNDGAVRPVRVLIIRNTVKDAIATQLALEAELRAVLPGVADEILFMVDGQGTLHHGRYAPTDRRRRDETVEAAFGKEAPRTAKIMIGTQTLEQSLDIDADLLITDMCPADVLLQRIGRLWRHVVPGRDGEAPCVVLRPQERDLSFLLRKANFGVGKERAYSDVRSVEATLRWLEARVALDEPVRIPEMNRPFVEAATHPDSLRLIGDESPDWLVHQNDVQMIDNVHGMKARFALFDLDTSYAEPADMRDPEQDSRAATRLGTPDVTIRFDPPVPNPLFARGLLETINLPGWQCRAEENDEIRDFQSGVDEVGPWIAFSFGSSRFSGKLLSWRYDRLGLRVTN